MEILSLFVVTLYATLTLGALLNRTMSKVDRIVGIAVFLPVIVQSTLILMWW